MNNFDIAFEEVIGLEGGYVNDPDDPGGETKYGISKRSYPHVDIASLTLEDAKQIYWQDYWNPLLLSRLYSATIAVEMFEQAVNFGRSVAVTHAQQALNMLGENVVVDGIMGDQTVGALNRSRFNLVVKTLNGLQFMRYVEICENRPRSQKYFVGWLRRVSL